MYFIEFNTAVYYYVANKGNTPDYLKFGKYAVLDQTFIDEHASCYLMSKLIVDISSDDFVWIKHDELPELSSMHLTQEEKEDIMVKILMAEK